MARVIVEWNSHVGPVLKCRIEPVRWELAARPELGESVQGVLNEAIVDEADFGIALFWTRVGTPTVEHVSGSAEEVERLVQLGRSVMIYFCDAAPPAGVLDPEQWQRLQELRAAYEKRGPIAGFETTDELERLVHSHLTSLVAGLARAHDDQEGRGVSSSSGRRRELATCYARIYDEISSYVLAARNLMNAFEFSGEAALDEDVGADEVLKHAIEAYNLAYDGLHGHRESYIQELALVAGSQRALSDELRDVLGALDEAHRHGPFAFNKTYRDSLALRALRRKLSDVKERPVVEVEIRLLKASAMESIRNTVADTNSALRALEQRADGLARKVDR